MVSATVNSVTTTFAYRGDGLRHSRTVGANTTVFTWNIASGLPVVIDHGNQYVYGAGLAAMKQSGSWYYYLADGLGSTMAIVDASGNSQTSYQYDVYGEVTGGSGSLANEFDFDSQQTDGTGLQYLRARYYDPATGTFLSRDPLGRTEELASQRTPTAVRDDRLFAILRVCSQAPRRMTGALSALGGGLTVLRREPGRKLQIPSPRSYSTVNLPARTLFDIAFGRRA